MKGVNIMDNFKITINKKEKEFPTEFPFVVKYRTNDNLYLVSKKFGFDNSPNKILLTNIETGIIQDDTFNCIDEISKNFELVSSEMKLLLIIR